jgi:hypothetical protein
VAELGNVRPDRGGVRQAAVVPVTPLGSPFKAVAELVDRRRERSERSPRGCRFGPLSTSGSGKGPDL